MRTPVRLLGVRVSHLLKIPSKDKDNLITDVCQMDLNLDTGEEKNRLLTLAMDNIRDKYGENIIKPAGVIDR